jgi:GT2 family glycosyltransferase
MRPPAPVVSIVMVAFGGGWEWVPRALDALRRNTDAEYEVILVDNGGGTEPHAFDDRDVEVVRNTSNRGFGEGSHQGASLARSDNLVFLNTDVLVEPRWLPPLLERVAEVGVGAVFPAKLNLDGTMQEAGAFVTGEANAYVFGDGEDAAAPDYAFPREVDFGSAAAMCLTRARYESMSGFDPAYRIAYYEDADLCFRLRKAGFRLVYEPRARVTHARSVSAPPGDLVDVYAANRGVFVSRWGHLVEGRPPFERLAADPTARLAARDIHARHRLLLVDGGEGMQRLASELASAHPRARVTLLTEQVGRSREDALLESGVEVARPERVEDWLAERAGHYTHVVSPQHTEEATFRSLRETQPEAAFVAESAIDGIRGELG